MAAPRAAHATAAHATAAHATAAHDAAVREHEVLAGNLKEDVLTSVVNRGCWYHANHPDPL